MFCNVKTLEDLKNFTPCITWLFFFGWWWWGGGVIDSNILFNFPSCVPYMQYPQKIEGHGALNTLLLNKILCVVLMELMGEEPSKLINLSNPIDCSSQTDQDDIITVKYHSFVYCTCLCF